MGGWVVKLESGRRGGGWGRERGDKVEVFRIQPRVLSCSNSRLGRLDFVCERIYQEIPVPNFPVLHYRSQKKGRGGKWSEIDSSLCLTAYTNMWPRGTTPPLARRVPR